MIIVYIVIITVTVVLITLFFTLTAERGDVNTILHNTTAMSEIQLSSDIYVINSVYDYRINSFRLFIYSPERFSKLSCKLEYQNTQRKCLYYYRPYRIFSTPYGHLIIKNKHKSLPEYIVLNDVRIKVDIPYQKTSIFNLSVCICNMINYTAVNRFIQTIESYKYFGVDHFTIYLTTASEEVMKVIKYYQSFNLIELIIGNVTFETNDYMKKLMYGQLAKGDDCIYRNMKKSRAVIVADLDEIIWPVKHNTINEMINSLKGYNNYVIRSFHFHTEIINKFDLYIHNVPDTDIFLYHEYCRYKQGWVQKNIYTKLDSIYSIFIHWVMDHSKKFKEMYVPYELAYVRHTRRLKYLKEISCETDWMLMPSDSREIEINKQTKMISEILNLKPPAITNPIILKKRNII